VWHGLEVREPFHERWTKTGVHNSDEFLIEERTKGASRSLERDEGL
jgi:hypothetical protein